MNLVSKIETVWWFLKNPRYLPQIFQLIKRLSNDQLERSREESTRWCIANRLDKNEALKALGLEPNYQLLDEIFPSEIGLANKKVSEVEVTMGGQGDISMIYYICKGFNVSKAVESGVAYGWSTLAILLALKDNKNSKLISNDMPYVKMNNEDFVGCVVPEKFHQNWQLQRLPDISGLPLAFEKMGVPIDLFHYDSDKSYTGRMWASRLIWSNLRQGGVFISDDINDNLAFKHFSEIVKVEPIIVEHLGKYVGILIK